MSESQPSPRSASETAGRVSTLLITNGTKLVGIYVFLKEVSRESRSDTVLLICAGLMLGAQTVEAVALKAIDRIFKG